MGTKGAKKSDWETAASLRAKAAAMEETARKLRELAERMDRRRVQRLKIFRAPAAKTAVEETLPIFAMHALKKVIAAGA
jgi:hypothetical protein